jgi:hypothetical protein
VASLYLSKLNVLFSKSSKYTRYHLPDEKEKELPSTSNKFKFCVSIWGIISSPLLLELEGL